MATSIIPKEWTLSRVREMQNDLAAQTCPPNERQLKQWFRFSCIVMLSLLDEVERAKFEQPSYEALVSKARQFERYPGGEGARKELRRALDMLGFLDEDRKALS